ncbi:hypothetical protein NPIL_216851 [Nephila pilipes]|uniref:Uncharacterized protein n=1 Tax=Nephila pilipes TaxID=299642 RepID=A0A8X6MNU0_NEPPI|nr:hypothetical protein NPIL_216851 [Nephila pilipes]
MPIYPRGKTIVLHMWREENYTKLKSNMSKFMANLFQGFPSLSLKLQSKHKKVMDNGAFPIPKKSFYPRFPTRGYRRAQKGINDALNLTKGRQTSGSFLHTGSGERTD